MLKTGKNGGRLKRKCDALNKHPDSNLRVELSNERKVGIMKMVKNAGVTLAGACLLLGAATSATASLVVTGSGKPTGDSYTVTAQATFTALPGNELQITLANIGTTATADIGGLVYGVSFSGAAGTLSLVSASALAGETEWDAGSSTALTSTLNVMSSGGNNPGWILNGNDVTALHGGTHSFALLSEGYAGGTSGGLSNGQHNPNIQDYLVLVLSGYTGGNAGLSSISDVVFGIGTSDDTITATSYGTLSTTAVPEPSTIFAAALLLLPFGASALRIYRNRARN